jgi:ribonuclease HI
MKLRTYSDGGARGNPGPGAIGVLVCDARDHILLEHKDVIGRATNNIAEYCALIGALALAKEMGAEEVESFLDSELVVRQLGGVYRVKSDHIKELIQEVRKLEQNFRKVSYQHLPRTHNMLRQADRLVNLALDQAEADSAPA